MKRTQKFDDQYGFAPKLYKYKDSYPINVQAYSNKEKRQYFQQKSSKNASSKTNIETSILSEIQSLQYQFSQQPSFSSKVQFTVLEDFNGENHQLMVISNNQNKKKFLLQDLTIKEKCIKVLQLLQELRVIKESFEYKMRQQQCYFINQLQELKKVLSINLDKKQNQLLELRLYCKQIEQQKVRSLQKYSSKLKKYQQQIEIISEELSRRINSQRQQNLHSASMNSSQGQCQRCRRLQQMLQNQAANYQQACRSRCMELQKRHKQRLMIIQTQMYNLKQQLRLSQSMRRRNEIKQYLSSEYYTTNNEKKTTPVQKRQKHDERSDSASSRASRIDIKARLKEIQMIKANSREKIDNRLTSRYSSKDSRYTGGQRNSKDHQRESGQSIKISEKLNKLTETLQNQLKSIN